MKPGKSGRERCVDGISRGEIRGFLVSAQDVELGSGGASSHARRDVHRRGPQGDGGLGGQVVDEVSGSRPSFENVGFLGGTGKAATRTSVGEVRSQDERGLGRADREERTAYARGLRV